MGNKVSASGRNKVRGMQLPGQGGKTRKMEEKVSEFQLKSRMNNCGDDLNILFTSNNKLLVEQTSTRFNDDLGPQSDNDSVSDQASIQSAESEVILVNGSTTWTSDKNQKEEELAWTISNYKVDMLMCCAHPKRIKKTAELIKMLNESPLFNRKINIWFDEAHKSIKLWSKYEDILDLPKISSAYLVTASWPPIDKKYTGIYRIRRDPYEKTCLDIYRTLSELKWITVEPLKVDTEDEETDSGFSSVFYIQQILSHKDHKKLFESPGIYLMPGNTRTSSHDLIEEELAANEWSGLKLNGTQKRILVHRDEETIDELNYSSYNSDRKEPKNVLLKLFTEYPHLHQSKFYVTGLNCIKEGITIQGIDDSTNNRILFKGGIIPPMTDECDAYQLACRMAGNIKAITPKGFECFIVTTSAMKKKILRQENINIFLPQILWKEERESPTDFDIKRAARGKCAHDHKGHGFRVFSKYKMFEGYLKKLGRNSGFKNTPNGVNDGEHDYSNMYVCSVQSSRGAKQMPRYLSEVIDKIDLAYGGQGYRSSFPAYLDMKESNGKITVKNEDLVWVAVIPPTVEKNLVEEADRMFPDEYDELIKRAKHF